MSSSSRAFCFHSSRACTRSCCFPLNKRARSLIIWVEDDKNKQVPQMSIDNVLMYRSIYVLFSRENNTRHAMAYISYTHVHMHTHHIHMHTYTHKRIPLLRGAASVVRRPIDSSAQQAPVSHTCVYVVYLCAFGGLRVFSWFYSTTRLCLGGCVYCRGRWDMCRYGYV